MTITKDSLYMTKKEIRSFFKDKGLSKNLVDKNNVSALTSILLPYFPKNITFKNFENNISDNLESVLFFHSRSMEGISGCSSISPEFSNTEIAADYVCRRIKKSDMIKLSKATNARVINNISELRKEDLGNAISVKQTRIGNENLTLVQSKNPKSVTILIRGGTEHIVDEAKRAMDDALGGLISAIKTGFVVSGAGSLEMELSRILRKYSETFSGKEQLAIQAFSTSLEIIPKTLAENAGLDPINVITDLKSKHEEGKKEAGIDVFTGRTINAWKMGIIEPLMIKKQALNSASEVTNMILRIDDVILSSKTN